MPHISGTYPAWNLPAWQRCAHTDRLSPATYTITLLYGNVVWVETPFDVVLSNAPLAQRNYFLRLDTTTAEAAEGNI